jgi:hypothetical protein
MGGAAAPANGEAAPGVYIFRNFDKTMQSQGHADGPPLPSDGKVKNRPALQSTVSVEG